MKKIFNCLMAFTMPLVLLTACNNEAENSEKNRISTTIREIITTNGAALKSSTDYLKAIDMLEKDGYDVKLTDVLSKDAALEMYNNISYTYSTNDATDIISVSSIYNGYVYASLYNFDKTPYEEYLGKLTFDSLKSWDYYTVYEMIENESQYSSLKSSLISAMNNYNGYLDSDTAAMILNSFKTSINIVPFVEEIKKAASTDGIYNEYSGYNACSTSQAIIGLISIDLNPYNFNEINLVDALYTFYKDGAFIANDEADLSFSTPQGFKALATIYCYL